ncbi:PREDICTED: B3 domain-containing transcription factor VRN1-like isoform X1 [Fragaria vesca subsp. vesca]|uniref:B3 domain-containing transcription factor VRN1-like isoform X1 n=1 Tax=Fragaria vesca subsp. vesca TaxID=101020 RepID=UPI0002C31150|nr:PREDICTED: B3 domain-containing transcription factor VRN1-like isoform X1 [Fragaria vesca subsp. vesca]
MGSLRKHQTFSSTTPQFFQIILEDTSRDIKIRIPKKFVMKYGQDVSNSARLKLPSGAEWQVELTRCNGKVWFEKGWPEFSKFFSLDYGNFLVFRYEGNSVFQVCIFDRTATEIDYPIAMPGMEETDHEDEEGDDISIEILEDSPLVPRPEVKREKSPLPCPPSYKKMRTSWSDKTVETMSENDVGGSSPTRKCLNRTLEDLGEFQSLNNDEKARALLGADGFISEKAHFKVVMQPSYVQQSYLGLPAKFFKENQIKAAAYVTLRVSNGKTWSVKFNYEQSKATLQHGWLAFVKDNCLKVGDVCVFVLIKDINLLFQVEIFRATIFPVLAGHSRGAAVHVEDNRSSMKVESDCGMDCGMASVNPSPLDIGNKNKGSETSGEVAERHCSFLRVPRDNLEAASKFIPKNPFFRVTIRAYHLARSGVNVPANFMKKSIKRLQEKQTVMLQVKNSLWPVNLVPRTQGSAGRLCSGWITFAREHDLKEGDVCVFELMEMKANNIVLEVHIFRCD